MSSLPKIKAVLAENGCDSMWSFLDGRPGRTWAAMAAEMQVVPRAVISAAVSSAPSRVLAAREVLYREILDFFPDGWESGEDAWTQHAKVAGGLASALLLDAESVRTCMERLYDAPDGWLPEGREDPELLRATSSLE